MAAKVIRPPIVQPGFEFAIERRSVEQPRGEAGLWVKFPPLVGAESPPTPELIDPTTFPVLPSATNNAINPVIQVMANAGLTKKVRKAGTLFTDLMHGMKIETWDGLEMMFFLFRQNDNPLAKGTFPAPTVRCPRGALFHAETSGHGPPPHTIHWHGIEPTPINDGVGHCSMEVGKYTYQWQPNFMGFYFYHCHRNTVQHFEYGLYGAMIFDAPDAFFATLVDPTVPIGAGRDGLFRFSANLAGTPLAALQTNFNPLNTPDPNPGAGGLTFPTDPHAFTVPYDVEALWVLDDRDIIWSENAPDARDFFPQQGNRPGINDKWKEGFFNDYRASHWYVTGVPSPGPANTPNVPVTIQPAAPPPLGGIGGIDVSAFGGMIPPGLMSGKGANGDGTFNPLTATQIAINAQNTATGLTILIRTLDAAYNYAEITFPRPVVVTGFDGRSLGVPPFGNYNNAFEIPLNPATPGRTFPITICTARRFDCVMRFEAGESLTGANAFAEVKFRDSQGITPTDSGLLVGPVVHTTRIPIVVTAPA